MVEIEFRDGKKVVPDHLADLMTDLKTHTMTYDEAVKQANWKLATDYADQSIDKIRQSHFRDLGVG